MSRSTPKPKFLAKLRDFFILALTVAVIAAIYGFCRPSPRVTISGLSLEDTRENVASHLEHLDYRHFSTGQWGERFYRMDSAGIDVVYDESGSVYRLEGGVPEIDGQDAGSWTPERVEQALGKANMGGTSRAVGESTQGYFAYPEHRVLIYFDPAGNRFVLFESAKDTRN